MKTQYKSVDELLDSGSLESMYYDMYAKTKAYWYEAAKYFNALCKLYPPENGYDNHQKQAMDIRDELCIAHQKAKADLEGILGINKKVKQ